MKAHSTAVVPDVAIVSYNTDDYLLNLLNSLAPLVKASRLGRVHVWDNASTDRTAEVLEVYGSREPWLRVVSSPVNVHHGPAIDALLREWCRSEWVLLLDADTEVRKPFDAALTHEDLRNAAFVGQIHPQMPHLYAYLAHLLVHRPQYLELPPFRHHGAPGVDYFRAIERERRPFVRFRWCDYVDHFGQGSLRRVVERNDRANEFHDFAQRQVTLHPKPMERARHEEALQANVTAFLAQSMDRASSPVPTLLAPVQPARRLARRSLGGGGSLGAGGPRSSQRLFSGFDLAADWLTSPRHARALHAARRMGLVQLPAEARSLAGLVRQLRPRRVVEIGTSHGGSFLLWARAAHPEATLVSVDLPPWELDDPAEKDKRAAILRVGSRRQTVHAIRGSSHDADVRRQVTERLGDHPIDFLFIDGDHWYEGVTRDVADYAGLVRPGGIVALHDIHPHSRGWGGDVPVFWPEIRGRFRHRELIADSRQDGFGIGVIWV